MISYLCGYVSLFSYFLGKLFPVCFLDFCKLLSVCFANWIVNADFVGIGLIKNDEQQPIIVNILNFIN